MSSVHEVIPWAGHANYAASKGGVDLMMQSLAQEVAGERIRVHQARPVNFAGRFSMTEEKRPASRAANHPLPGSAQFYARLRYCPDSTLMRIVSPTGLAVCQGTLTAVPIPTP